MADCTALSAAIPQDIFAARKKAGARPNILFCIADDQSWPHEEDPNLPQLYVVMEAGEDFLHYVNRTGRLAASGGVLGIS